MSTYSVGTKVQGESKFRAAHFSVLLPLLAFFIEVSRVWSVLPAVMQDEYVYSVQARFTPFAEQLYPNYLFSALYSSTSACGTDFYSCAKGLNAGFFAMFLIFIWLIAARLFSVWVASFVTTVVAISPIHVYVSYFMPEMMYFAVLAAVIWWALRVAFSPTWVGWAWLGFGLGLAALVKPHAIFVLPAFLLFAVLVAWRAVSLRIALLAGGALVGAFAIVKFGLGFLIAGANGLSLFGSSYTSSIGSFVSTVSQGSFGVASPEQAMALGGSLVLAAEPVAASGAELFIGTSLDQILLHSSLLVLIAGLPLALGLRVFGTSLKKLRRVTGESGEVEREPLGGQSSFVILIALLSVSMALVVALFEGVVTALGDDHSWRVITRYYEFLFPMFVMLGFSMNKFVESKFVGRAIQFAIVIGLAVVALVRIPAEVKASFADSIFISGLLAAPGVAGWVFAFAAVGAVVWLLKPEWGNQVIAWGAIPLMLIVTGAFAQTMLLGQVGTTKAYFDVAGQAAHEALVDVPGSEVVVVGQTRTEVFTSKFWIDKAGIVDVPLNGATTFDVNTIADADYALVLGQVALVGESQQLLAGDGYQLVKVN